MQDSQLLLEKVRNYKPESGPGVISNFIGSTLHMDYMNETVARIEDMRSWNEECKSNEYLETRGGIKAMRLMLAIFESLLHNKESDTREGDGDEKEI